MRILRFSKNYLLIASALVIVSVSPRSFGQSICAQVHREKIPAQQVDQSWKPQIITPLATKLDPVRLKENQFAISENGSDLLDLRRPKGQQNIGSLKSLDAKYLFEWASHEEHLGIVDDHGISDSYMEDILNATGQVVGKGFYVSTNPLDSNTYGSDVTVFSTKGTVIVLEAFRATMRDLTFNTKFVKRLQAAGIDALRMQGYQENWYAVISTKHLQNPTAMTANVLSAYYPTIEKNSLARLMFAAKSSVFPKGAWLALPPENIFRRFYLDEPLSIEELKVLHARFKSSDHKYDESLGKLKLAERAALLLVQAKDPEAANEALLFLKNMKFRSQQVKGLQALLEKRISTRDSNIYKAVIEIFDLRTVATLSEPQKLAEPIQLSTMKKAALGYLEGSKQLQFKSIGSLDSFLRAGKLIYGISPKLRSKSYLMTEANQSDSQTIELSEKALSILKKNSILTLTPSDEGGSKKLKPKFYVEYLTLEKSKIFLSLLSPGLQSEIKSFIQRGRVVDYENPKIQNLMQEALKEITQALMDPKSLVGQSFGGIFLKTPEDFYRLFISLHPFHDGNGRMARLYYQIVQEKLRTSPEETRSSLDLAIYDLDLYLESVEFGSALAIGTALKYWASQAKDDAEFLVRCKWAIELYFRLFPELRPQFPEVSPIGEN
jgi:hypothetical protein